MQSWKILESGLHTDERLHSHGDGRVRRGLVHRANFTSISNLVGERDAGTLRNFCGGGPLTGLS
ncbi:MAG: hypothetical protein O3A00_03430 [Planctomycetota bacterium]|nr:hypothetical protein [Planctomycetota bacterium]